MPYEHKWAQTQNEVSILYIHYNFLGVKCNKDIGNTIIYIYIYCSRLQEEGNTHTTKSRSGKGLLGNLGKQTINFKTLLTFVDIR